MIRRQQRLPSGAPAWALISQQQHAQVSGDLARRVVDLPTDPGVADQLVAAIYAHDDGWADWMSRPQLDDQGRPVSFMEMQLEDALTIWDRSIARAEQLGPLPAWLVAAHFSRLLADSESFSQQPRAIQWGSRQSTCQEDRLRRWGGRAAMAEVGLGWLRALDAASLWICCGCPALGDPSGEPMHLDLGAGPSAIRWESAAAGQIVVRSPRLEGLPLEVAVSGLQTPVAKYRTPEELLAAATPCQLRWRLSAA